MTYFYKLIAIGLSVLAFSSFAASAQSDRTKAEVQFYSGGSGRVEPTGNWGRVSSSLAGLLVFEQFEGPDRIDGVVPITNGVFNVNLGDQIFHIYSSDPILSEMSLVYKDSEIVDFFIDYTSGLNPVHDLGVISVKGNRSYLDIYISEDHGDGIYRKRDWNKEVGFGLSVTREGEYEYYCSGSQFTDFGPFTQSDELGCFYKMTINGNTCWVDYVPKISFAACQQRDSCREGGAGTNGDCFKYSYGHAAPPKAWK